MDIILHMGAHRCATTSFQAYLDQNRVQLGQNGVSVWTPFDTRCGLFDGMVCPPGQGNPAQIDVVRKAALGCGTEQLIVSEENMIGTPRNNLALQELYPTVRARLVPFGGAFNGHVKRIGLAIRSYESYWVSAMSFAAMRGQALPDRAQCAALAYQARTWTQVVGDIRQSFPDVPIHVWLFEVFAGNPRRQFNMLAGREDITNQLDQTTAWKNTSRTVMQLRNRLRAHGRLDELALLPRANESWMPFTILEQRHMARTYADDLANLRSGADPMIHFTANAAIKVLRRNNTQARPAFDIGDNHGQQAKMG